TLVQHTAPRLLSGS
ncbi:hypothetical protein AB1N83_014203, partial [Pleurotus pulmonarius]